MEFALESEMHAPASEWLHSLGLVVRSESPVPWGICDLIGCKPNLVHVDRRLSRGQTQILGSHTRALLFSMIPDENERDGITLSELRDRIGNDHVNRHLECEIETLVRRRFVEVTSSGYKARNGWKPLHRRLVAIELKLRRVPTALGQARRNLGFADESYVGLPMPLAKRLAACRRSRFTDQGIGLLGVAEGGCRVLIRSRPAAAVLDDILQTVIVERFWRDFKKDRST
jgi:hypothetical protein